MTGFLCEPHDGALALAQNMLSLSQVGADAAEWGRLVPPARLCTAGRPAAYLLRRHQAVHSWRLEAFSSAVMAGTLLRPSSHLLRGSLDSTSQSEAGCLPLLQTHPRCCRLNRISPRS